MANLNKSLGLVLTLRLGLLSFIVRITTFFDFGFEFSLIHHLSMSLFINIQITDMWDYYSDK